MPFIMWVLVEKALHRDGCYRRQTHGPRPPFCPVKPPKQKAFPELRLQRLLGCTGGFGHKVSLPTRETSSLFQFPAVA